MFGGLIIYIVGSELVSFSLIKTKLYRDEVSVLLGDESMEGKFETISYFASWNLL